MGSFERATPRAVLLRQEDLVPLIRQDDLPERGAPLADERSEPGPSLRLPRVRAHRTRGLPVWEGVPSREYRSHEAIQRAMRPGRPILGASKQGPSPVVRGVVPVEEFDALHTLAERSGKGRSELVRQAVHDLSVTEKLVG